MSTAGKPERVARRRRASAALTMDPLRALLGVLVGPGPGPIATTPRSRALGALLFVAFLAAIFAVTLARA